MVKIQDELACVPGQRMAKQLHNDHTEWPYPDINDDKDMLDLITQIATEYPVPPLHAVIWLPNEFLLLGPSVPEDLKARLVDQTVKSIIDISHSGVQVKKTHVVIEIPPPPAARARHISPEGEIDFVGTLAKSVLIHLLLANIIKGNFPSASAQPEAYNAHQGKSLAIFDGRYNAVANQQTIAPPIEIFHPVFTRAKLADTEMVIPEDIIHDIARFMRSSSAIRVSEQSRSHTLLSKILKQSSLHAVASADIA
ncbi:hypothetical protein IW262DRAFT_1457897 [Armillaria fumosa]|nr:hypothetical protein IW262DRAFT_1457897 [Armillaria fumosa]